MNGYYYILDALKAQLELDNDVNFVNIGLVDDVLLCKKDIYPYSHIIVNNASLEGNTHVFNVSIICMDIVDISKEQTTNKFRGNSNLQDVLNTQFLVINRMVDVLKRGENTNLYTIDGAQNCEPFEDRFEHGVAGWTVTMDFRIPNTMTICEGATPALSCANALVRNSNGTYSESVVSGSLLVLPDTTYNFVVNGVTTAVTLPTLEDQTINVVWT